MSRIPVPTHSPSVDRSSSPVPHRHPSSMSASNISSLADTRKKQSKRDEVRLFSLPFPPSNPSTGNPQENRVRTRKEAHHLNNLSAQSQQTSSKTCSDKGNSRCPQAQSRSHRSGEYHCRRSKSTMCCQAHRLCPRRRRRRRSQRHIHCQGLGI